MIRKNDWVRCACGAHKGRCGRVLAVGSDRKVHVLLVNGRHLRARPADEFVLCGGRRLSVHEAMRPPPDATCPGPVVLPAIKAKPRLANEATHTFTQRAHGLPRVQMGLTMALWTDWTHSDSLYRLGVHFGVGALLLPNYPSGRSCKPLTAIRQTLRVLTGEDFSLHRCDHHALFLASRFSLRSPPRQTTSVTV